MGRTPKREDHSISTWFVIWNFTRNEQHLGQCGTGDMETRVKSDILCYQVAAVQIDVRAIRLGDGGYGNGFGYDVATYE